MVRSMPYFETPNWAAAVVDRNLGHARPGPTCKRGQEAVHFAVEADVLSDLAAVGLERAAVVVQVDARAPRDKPVGDHRGQFARDGLVLTVLAPAARHIVALVQLGQQQPDVGRIVLQVRVHRHDNVAGGRVEARGHRSRLTEIAPEYYHLHVLRVGGVQFAANLDRAVFAPVVHENNLVAQVRKRLHCGVYFAVQRRQRLFLVVDRHHDG